jgi:hypothetical protein
VPQTFLQAFEHLLSRAPGPVFPRARQLYSRKYALEGEVDTPFRTFLLEEEIQESQDGAVRSRAIAFAVVHWHGPPLERQRYAAYLAQQWQLQPGDLPPVDSGSWFRGGGAWARFSAVAVYERAAATTLVSPMTTDPEAPRGFAGPSR